MSVAPGPFCHAWGYLSNQSTNTSSFSVNAAATWWAMSFTPDTARTLNAVRLRVASVTGTPGSGDITASLYDSTGTAGAPGSAIQTGKLPTATINAAGWYDFTGFTTALTPGKSYWIVIKNGNGTPASNFCAMQSVTNVFQGFNFSGLTATRNCWTQATSTNSGTAWSTGNGSGMRVQYADGSYSGAPVQAVANSADLIFGTREAGVKFTSPPCWLNVLGACLWSANATTGTPTGTLLSKLYFGTAQQGVSNATFATGTGDNNSFIGGFFSGGKVIIPPSTVCRVSIADSAGNADTSSNAYMLRELTVDSDANSLILLPCNGTLGKTYFDGTSWTDTATAIYAFALLLDPAGEFALPPSGQLTGAFARGGYF